MSPSCTKGGEGQETRMKKEREREGITGRKEEKRCQGKREWNLGMN